MGSIVPPVSLVTAFDRIASLAPGFGSPPHGPAFCGSPSSLVFSQDVGVSSLKWAAAPVVIAKAAAVTKADENAFLIAASYSAMPSGVNGGNGVSCRVNGGAMPRIFVAILALVLMSPIAANAQAGSAAKSVEPFKVGTFRIGGASTVGLVLRDMLVVDLVQA